MKPLSQHKLYYPRTIPPTNVYDNYKKPVDIYTIDQQFEKYSQNVSIFYVDPLSKLEYKNKIILYKLNIPTNHFS